MSVDTRIVIAGYRFPGDSYTSWTAGLLQSADDLFEEDENAMEMANAFFLVKCHPWFGKISRAKAFASLLAQDAEEQGRLEYQERPIILIRDDKVRVLSKDSRRKRRR